jgi:hypothetical protein
MIAVERNDTTVVAPEKVVTVVSRAPLHVVTQVSDTVSVVTSPQTKTVVSVPVTNMVIPVQKPVTVVAAGEQVGPKIFFSTTPPSGAKLNDIWIKTSA